jgi:hypothetical protein
VLLPANALDKLPIFFESFKDVQSENSMFTPEICKDWNEVHWYECGWYLDCPISKTPHSELELRNRLEPAFVAPIVEEDLPRSAPTKGKRKNISQVLEQSQDHDIFNDQPSSKKLKVSKPITSSNTNPALCTILEPFTSLKIKTKASQTTQCSYDKDTYELILNDSFLNILNVKEETNSRPQSFHDINAFLTKVFFLPILSNYKLSMQLCFELFSLTIY